MDSTGDGAAIRAQGAALHGAAEDIATIARTLHARIEELRFSGPAAERFQAEMQEREMRLSRVSHELDELAGLVEQYAGTLPA